MRIVFAPEQQITFYGGDPDNFEFPRYDLDICLFRACENGRPARVKNFLRFSSPGAGNGEPVFVSGHSGRTSRLLTVAELTHLRDQALPFRLSALKRLEVLLGNWSAQSEENARRARDDFFGVQNSRKALDRELAGLLDPDLMDAKSKAEADFKARLADKPEFAYALGAFGQIAAVNRTLAAQATRQALLEGGKGFNCESFSLARALLRAGDERSKPDGEHLHEFSDSGKESLELELFSEKSTHTDLIVAILPDHLSAGLQKATAEQPPPSTSTVLLWPCVPSATGWKRAFSRPGFTRAWTKWRKVWLRLADSCHPPGRSNGWPVPLVHGLLIFDKPVIKAHVVRQ